MEYRQIGRHCCCGCLGKVQIFLCLGAADSRLGLVLVLVRQVTAGWWLDWDCYSARLTAPVFLILIIMTFFFRECF